MSQTNPQNKLSASGVRWIREDLEWTVGPFLGIQKELIISSAACDIYNDHTGCRRIMPTEQGRASQLVALRGVVDRFKGDWEDQLKGSRVELAE